MQITDFHISGPLLIKNKIFRDERGFFTERFQVEAFKKIGIQNQFVQDNYSISKPQVLRGLHYQSTPAQSKLVTCVSGRIFDVIVDIRKDSKTYGEFISVEISSDDPSWFWVPAGFAHGFCVLGEEPAGVLYKVDQHWSGQGEGGILWNDPELGIPWPVKTPLVSEKDRSLPSWKNRLC